MGLVILTFIAPGQTLSPGEVRISSRPYQPQPQILRAESRLVRIGAVVRDSKGHIVSELKPGDFTIYDDGKKQGVSEFSIEKRQLRGPSGRAAVPPPATQPNLRAQEQRPRPRYVALYFDDLDTRFGDMRHVQLAAENFIHQGVGPQDKVALFTASGSGTVDFTPDATEILSAIENLKFQGRTIASSGCPRITPYDAYEIATQPEPPISSTFPPQGSPTYVTIVSEAVQCNCIDETNLEPDCKSQQQQIVQTESKEMWSSIREMSQDTLNGVQAVVDYLAKRPGERVLVLASSGFLTGTLGDRVDAVVDSALRTGVVINALDAKGLYTNEPSHGQTGDVDTANVVAMHEAESFGPAMTSATAAMADFAVGTGGRFFHNRNDLSAGYYSLAAAPETEYLLGFAPENAKLNGAFHKLKVEVNMPGKFYVQARPGYFAAKQASETSGPTPEEKIDAEVRGSDERSDFPLSVSERPVTASSGGRELSVQTRVDIQKLPFALQKDRHVDMLTFVIALFDSQGKMVTGKEAQMQFALKPESFERFSKSGISGAMSLEARPGSYRLRVVVEEALHGEISATSQSVQIE
ncbi:MAG TPA: VWA domain-containing protein [Candidatus Acidoferrales bacterium]|nr:VWA domain-containing protein [Candidatus Acidoferrales bacterium]